MCIKGEGRILKEKDKDIIVYKVMMTHAVFFSVLGTRPFSVLKETETPWRGVKEKDMVKRKAKLWSKGMGYGCFATKKLAEEYRSSISLHRYYKVIKYRIPVGAKYQYGVIPKGFVGEGLEAMRAERLIKY